MKKWNDVYELPLSDTFIDGIYRSGRIFDSAGNFVFQFLNMSNKSQVKALDCINGVDKLTNKDLFFRHDEGYIYANETACILIRGWGRLTGTGGLNLSSDDAANIQDTFAEYIVEALNLR